MKRIFVFLFVLVLSLSSSWGGSFPTLKLGSTARSEALGMAYVAVADDASGGFWNPAGLASMRGGDAVLSLHRWIQDVRGEFLAFGWETHHGGYGVHVLYTDMGELEHRLTPSPTPLATFSAHEFVMGISFGRTIYNRLSVGLTAKLLYEKVYIEEAWGVAADFGFLWDVFADGLRIAGVVQNIGKTNPLQTEDIRLPFTVRLGVAYPLSLLGGRWWFVLDGVKERDFPFHLHGGVEYGWRERLFLRCGYQTGYETRDFTGGLGVTWGRYRLDYSYMPLGMGLGDSHRLTVGIHW